METPKTKVWVIDDEASMRALLRDFLVNQGLDVRCFFEAVEAIEALKRGDVPHVALCHVQMYPLDGLRFLRLAKKIFPSLPILLYTGAGSPEEKATALGLGAHHYLKKPFSLSQLKVLITQAVLNSSLPLPS